MLIIADIIQAKHAKDYRFLSLETPSCLHNADVSGAGTGCRRAALHHSPGHCDHSQNIVSIMTGPRLNFASLRARVLYRR